MRKPTDWPTDFSKAFRSLLPKMHVTKKRLLKYMMSLPDQVATPEMLMRHLGLKDLIVVNQTIGQLGFQVYKGLSEKHPDGYKKGEFKQYWHVIAESESDGVRFALLSEG